MSLHTLMELIKACDGLESHYTYKAIFLRAFFGFLRISNLAPHSLSQFDPSRHLTPADIVFKQSTMTVALKWSKTIQTRDRVHTIVLPKLGSSILCPVNALKRALAVYTPGQNDPLFQVFTSNGLQVVTESRLRKVLSRLNVKLGLDSHHFMVMNLPQEIMHLVSTLHPARILPSPTLYLMKTVLQYLACTNIALSVLILLISYPLFRYKLKFSLQKFLNANWKIKCKRTRDQERSEEGELNEMVEICNISRQN